VAVDLLSIDGSNLIDIPLLERKRLLDSASSRRVVRITPYVRPPIGSFALTWRALGFQELAYKPANGRYCRPASRATGRRVDPVALGLVLDAPPW